MVILALVALLAAAPADAQRRMGLRGGVGPMGPGGPNLGRSIDVALEHPHAGLFTQGITNALMGDGSVHVISEAVDTQVLKALMTRAGGEVAPNF